MSDPERLPVAPVVVPVAPAVPVAPDRLDAAVVGASPPAPDRSGRLGARSRGLLASLGLAFAAMLACAATAGAASFTVNDTTDAALESSGSTECVSTHGKSCTLRAAIQAADNTGGPNTIALPAGEYKLTIAATGADDPATGDLDVNGSATELTITGDARSNTIINANRIDRAFAVQNGESLTITDLTVENGRQNGLAPSENSTAPDDGGAFYNEGSLKIANSMLTDNSADGAGGVIYAGSAASSTTIEQSTVTGSASRGEGGALSVHSGSVSLTDDTINHDSAGGDGGVLAVDEEGGTEGVVKIRSSYLLSDVAASEGGALAVEHVAGMHVAESSLSYDNSDGSAGGAIYVHDSRLLSVSDSYLVGDTAGDGAGGAIYADANVDEMNVFDSTFEGDTARDGNGGAVAVEQTAISVVNSSFQHDQGDDGGALYIEAGYDEALNEIERSTFSEDDAVHSEGGAVYDAEGYLKLESSTLASNDASEGGGAVYYASGDQLVATNDTLDGNHAGLQGGALDFTSATVVGVILLVNDTIARNIAYEGGGIYEPANANVIENTIVADNVGGATEDGAGDCYGVAPTDNAGEADVGGNVDSDASCFSDSKPEDHTGVAPLLAELAENGGTGQGAGASADGTTDTDALLAGSPAIQAGVDSPEECPTTDQRGTRRSGGCDSGAFQFEPADVWVILEAPATAKVGEPLGSVLTVENNGPAPATGVTVTYTLPAGTYFSSAMINGYFAEIDRLTCSGTTTVTCTITGYLPGGDGIPILMTVIPGNAGIFRATAEVSAGEEDPEPANNTALGETTVSGNERVETVEITKTVSSTQTVYVAVPSGVSGSTSTIQAPCRSSRSAAISWQVPSGVHLRRIVVTRNGKTYSRLAGSARKATVSMVGLPKGAVAVTVSGHTAAGRRYAMTRTFHPCVSSKQDSARPSSDYLTRQ